MIDDGENSLADGNIELNKEKFYEFSKRIQSIGVKGYFNTIKKNLNIKIEKPFTPQELCSAYENISRITYSNTKVAKKFWTDEENIFLVSLVTYFTYLNDEDFNSIVTFIIVSSLIFSHIRVSLVGLTWLLCFQERVKGS